ncbi:hypothetical protein [Hydrogenophaga sp. MI9]|uniref:hypothetical protein n=1 Tax=Hydrogenophaga sp. MI9 TaxID=3453719 RepID=UPI003EEEAE95
MPLAKHLLSLLASATLAPAAFAGSFSFGLWGDMPYEKNNDAQATAAVIRSIDRADIAFSIFDGDIKDGSSACTDEVFTRAANTFNAMKKPVVYVPGDNEWTDCHRKNNGGWNNLERLDTLRKLMFADSRSFGRRKLALEHQDAPFAENTRFHQGGIVFAQVNVAGSNNNRVLDEKDCSAKSARTAADCEADNAEYAVRNAAVNRWIEESFAQARQRKAKGIVLTLQADPGFDLPETEELDEAKTRGWNRPESGYKDLMDTVIRETQAFAGQVLFVHGDTHVFKLDKPLHAPLNLLPNFTRLQTFGSPNNHWVHVTVDTRKPGVFTVRPVMVKVD